VNIQVNGLILTLTGITLIQLRNKELGLNWIKMMEFSLCLLMLFGISSAQLLLLKSMITPLISINLVKIKKKKDVILK